MTGAVIERRLAGRVEPDFAIHDVVERQKDGQRVIRIFFDRHIPNDAIVAPKGAQFLRALSLGGASVFEFALKQTTPPEFNVLGQAVELTCAEAELSLMEGKNALAAVRNGESAQTVLDWLSFHADHHNAQTAVILDRAEPGTDKNFVQDLKAGLHKRKLSVDVAILTSDLPLGKDDHPAEAHPFCVPEAPGKDRMVVPQPSPWDSPLGAMTLYEIMRARFLADARAIANIDVHDLIPPVQDSVFDSAVAAQGGLVALLGRHCYPWRVRNGAKTTFGDHICVQFDATFGRRRWCIAPAKSPENALWRMVRIGNAKPDQTRSFEFYRHMALRHPTPSISKIVPKTSLIEQPQLLSMAQELWHHDPVRMPELEIEGPTEGRGRCAIVTTMKNEGPFILEWIAHHRAIGFDDILVYTNDCTDGTDTLLELLQSKGIVQHRDNKFRDMDLKPQHAALQSAEEEAVIQKATWVTCIDVDEFVNIKCGDGTLDALFQAVPDANMISMTWRLFGNGDVHLFKEGLITEQFFRCAPEYARKPHQAWGFKTLFRNIGLFKKLGVHRPKGLNPQLWEKINWVNGSGALLPRDMFRNGWRSTIDTYGYDLVQLNHYAVRSAESFLVKRDRGRVNHVDRDQGLAYWFRMNNNYEEDRSIERMVPTLRAELANLMRDPEIAAAHAHCVARHRAKIDALKATENYAKFYDELTQARMEKLSRLHDHFGSNIFLSGPSVIPDEIAAKDPDEDWFFTVELEGQTQH